MIIVIILLFLGIWYSTVESRTIKTIVHPSSWDLGFLDRYRNNPVIYREILQEIRSLSSIRTRSRAAVSKRIIMNQFHAFVHSLPSDVSLDQFHQDMEHLEKLLNEMIDYTPGPSKSGLDIHTEFYYKNHPFPAEQMGIAEHNYSYFL